MYPPGIPLHKGLTKTSTRLVEHTKHIYLDPTFRLVPNIVRHFESFGLGGLGCSIFKGLGCSIFKHIATKWLLFFFLHNGVRFVFYGHFVYQLCIGMAVTKRNIDLTNASATNLRCTPML